nr:alcohol dehydrogenase catalytic domain-containing protein [Paracoccus mutanolyticus]
MGLSEKATSPAMGEWPARAPGPDEVAVRLRAAALNFADLLMLDGRYQDTPPRPFIPGLEGAGEVIEAGPEAGLAPGTRVAVYSQGTMAEANVFPAAHCVPIPDTMGWAEAAGFLIAYGTSHLALSHRAGLRAGDALAVLGAAGGVGLTAVEIGAALGARVIAVARGAARLKRPARPARPRPSTARPAPTCARRCGHWAGSMWSMTPSAMRWVRRRSARCAPADASC